MFSRIMLPVDLARKDRQHRALQISADIARLYDATIIYTAIAGREPSVIARTPRSFDALLAEFARQQGEKFGVATGHHAVFAHDPASQLNPLLIRASIDIRADLIVVGSHFRGRWSSMSHATRVAAGATASVLIVRPRVEE